MTGVESKLSKAQWSLGQTNDLVFLFINLWQENPVLPSFLIWRGFKGIRWRMFYGVKRQYKLANVLLSRECWCGRFSDWSSGARDCPSLPAGGSTQSRNTSKDQGLFNGKGRGFPCLPFCGTEEVRGPRELLFTAGVLMDKPTTRAGRFSKSRRETGSGTMGLFMQHRWKLEKSGARWCSQLFSSSLLPVQLDFTKSTRETIAVLIGYLNLHVLPGFLDILNAIFPSFGMMGLCSSELQIALSLCFPVFHQVPRALWH